MLSLSNPYALPLKDVKASVLVDGRQVQSKTIGTVLPRQQRSVLFASVPLMQAGQHEVKVTLESGGPRRVTGFMAKQVQVGPKVIAPVGPTKITGVVEPIKPVRPVVAPFNVGGIRVAVGPGGAKSNGSSKSSGTRIIGPLKPEGPRATGTREATGAKVVGPKPIGGVQTNKVTVIEPPKSSNTKVGPARTEGTDSSRSAGKRASGSEPPKTGNSRIVVPAKPQNTRATGVGTRVIAPTQPSRRSNPSAAGGGVVTPITPGKRRTPDSNSNRTTSSGNANANRKSNRNVNTNANNNRSP
jgi:hypothetical protein